MEKLYYLGNRATWRCNNRPLTESDTHMRPM